MRLYRKALLSISLALIPSCAFVQTTTPPPQAIATPVDAGCCGPITPAGEHLIHVLDSMDVEHHWQEGMKVYWENGEPKGGSGHTHCSAFAAAAGLRLGVYMLRPPDHSQDLLASAQGRWFGSEKGAQDGWHSVATSQEAQSLANQGYLVVLDYINPDFHHPGHIAIVRPAIKSQKSLDRDGPQTTQAGLHNFTSGNAVRSFQAHPGAWPSHVLMFAHTIDFHEDATPALAP
jgi:hypothetical protein